jgi:hypothetical protein
MTRCFEKRELIVALVYWYNNQVPPKPPNVDDGSGESAAREPFDKLDDSMQVAASDLVTAVEHFCTSSEERFKDLTKDSVGRDILFLQWTNYAVSTPFEPSHQR